MINNPWEKLTNIEPFIASSDIEQITTYNALTTDDKYRLQTQIIPEPFSGNPAAPVYFLTLNPSYEANDLIWHKNADFRTSLIGNLTHANSDMPFYFLDNRYCESGGAKYWNSKLRWLTEQSSITAVANSIFSIEYLGYHSVSYNKKTPKILGEYLETQRYAAALVEKAMQDKKQIVLMRAKNEWFDLVPSLSGYDYLNTLNSAQNVSISPNNLTTFKEIVSLIKE